MFKKILLTLLIPVVAIGGLPPTSLKFNGESNYSTTFTLDFSIFAGTHSGVVATPSYLLPAGGGTGLTSTPTNGQLLIGNGTGYSLSTLTGTSNQITVTNGSGSITLSTPQDIATTSSPTFSSLTLTNPLGLSYGGSGKALAALAGGVVYSDSDSLEISAAGLSGQALVSGGTGAPTWFAPTGGSVLFAGINGALAEDNAKFFWDDGENTLRLGDFGSETSGININGSTYQSTIGLSNIGNLVPAQIMMHRHSTSTEPMLIGARSYTNSTSEGNIPADTTLLNILGTGWETNNYKIFGSIELKSSALGTLSSTSAPGSILFSTTNNSATTPSAHLLLDSDKSSTFYGTVNVPNFVGTGTTGAVRVHNLSTSQMNALTAANGMMVYNTTKNRMQCYVNGAWGECDPEYQTTFLAINNGASLGVDGYAMRQYFSVAGNGSPVTLSNTPFNIVGINGMELCFTGTSDANTVTFPANDAANGILGYSVTLGRGQTVTYKYNSSLSRWVIKSVSN